MKVWMYDKGFQASTRVPRTLVEENALYFRLSAIFELPLEPPNPLGVPTILGGWVSPDPPPWEALKKARFVQLEVWI